MVMNPFIFLSNCYRPKSIFLFPFGKVITLLTMLGKQSEIVRENSVHSKQPLNQFLNQVVLIAIFNLGRAWLEFLIKLGAKSLAFH